VPIAVRSAAFQSETLGEVVRDQSALPIDAMTKPIARNRRVD
jgi:hypothetical protein